MCVIQFPNFRWKKKGGWNLIYIPRSKEKETESGKFDDDKVHDADGGDEETGSEYQDDQQVSQVCLYIFVIIIIITFVLLNLAYVCLLFPLPPPFFSVQNIQYHWVPVG